MKKHVFSIIIAVLFFIIFLSDKIMWISDNTYLKLIVTIFLIIVTYILVLAAFQYSNKFSIPLKNLKISRKRIVIYALPNITIWSLYLIAFYPGVMTSDSFNQWEQMVTGNYYDANPVIHTFFNYIVTRVWLSPAAIALSQILILSVIIGYSLYTLESFGVSRPLLILATFMFSLNPVNGIMSITLWKDILYSGFILLFTVYIIKVILSIGEWIKKSRNFLSFIFVSLGVLFFRHNGIVPFTATVLLLMFFYRKYYKSFFIILVMTLAIYFGVRGPIFDALGVKPAPESEAFAIPTQQIAAVIKNNGYLTEEQKKKIAEIMPLESWSSNYMPGNVDYIKFNKEFNAKNILEDKEGFLKMWLQICFNNPKIALKAYGDQTAIAWSAIGYTNVGSRRILENQYGISQKILIKPLTNSANYLLDLSQKGKIRIIFWRPAVALFLIIFAGFMAILKNGIRFGIATAPIIFNTLTIILATPAQDFRYLYSNSLVVLILILYSVIKVSKNNYE